MNERKNTMRSLVFVSTALMLVLPGALIAQATPSPVNVPVAALRALSRECDATPRLKARSGGGDLELKAGETVRIPYGVPYSFMHRPGAGTDFVFVTLVVGDQRTRAEAITSTSDPGCYIVEVPGLPLNTPLTLIEQIGSVPAESRKTAIRDAIDAMRAEFIRRVFAGDYNDAIRRHQLVQAVTEDMPDLLATDSMKNLVVRIVDDLVPLDEHVTAMLAGAGGSLASLPFNVTRMTRVPGRMDAIATQCAAGYSALSEDERAGLITFRTRLRRIVGMTTQNVASYYARGGPLPFSSADLEGVVAAIQNACAAHPGLPELVEDVEVFLADPLVEVIASLEAARLLVEQSFTLTATEIFPGATKTLQRFGQLDAVNAYLMGRDEVRLVASFSFYPGDLSYGGEIMPNSWRDRLVLTAGYSMGTVVSDTTEVEADRTVFTAGAGYRLNEFFSLGAGRWFDGNDDDWYLNFSGDLGGIPFLRELFARKPEGFR